MTTGNKSSTVVPSALILPDREIQTPNLPSQAEAAVEVLKTAARLKSTIKYAAHLSKLLLEACGILETLDVSVDVSEELAAWWEREKRRQAAKGDKREIYSGTGHLTEEEPTDVVSE